MRCPIQVQEQQKLLRQYSFEQLQILLIWLIYFHYIVHHLRRMLLSHQELFRRENLGGIKDMKKLPDAIFIVDPKKEHICVQEAHTLGIPLIGIVDTNCDPEELDYVIPGNDDAIRAVKLIVSKMADAVIEAKQGEVLEGAMEIEVPADFAAESTEA